MIKKITVFLLSAFFAIIIFQPVWAQTATEEGAVAGQTQKEKIEDLKERVASKVAQLRTQVYKALVGEIKSVDQDSFVVSTRQGEKKIILAEGTKIFTITRGRKAALAVSGLEAGQSVAVIGLIDTTGEFVAKIILVKQRPLNINGVIEEIDKANFTVSVKNGRKGASYLVDIETTTKIRVWEKEGGLKTSGFSKLKVNDRIHVNGLRVAGEENRLSAIRLLVLPGLAVGITEASPTPKATSSLETPTSTSTPQP